MEEKLLNNKKNGMGVLLVLIASFIVAIAMIVYGAIQMDAHRYLPGVPLFVVGMVWACLQGRMGAVLANDTLSSAAAVLGDFAFFAGAPDRELLDAVSVPLLVPQNDAWAAVIAAYFGRAVQPIIRYATRKDTVFDRKRLETFARSLPNSYTIRKIDRNL